MAAAAVGAAQGRKRHASAGGRPLLGVVPQPTPAASSSGDAEQPVRAPLTASAMGPTMSERHSIVESFPRVSLAEEHMRNCSWQQAGLNCFFAMFAAAQIPFAIAQMGWWAGIPSFSLVCVCSWWSGHVLTDCCVRKSLYTWYDLGFEAFGRLGGLLVEILQTTSIVLTSIVQTQGAGSVWQQAFPASGICAWQWVLINLFPFLIFLQIPSFSGTQVMRVASAITIVLLFWQYGIYTVGLLVWGKYEYVCYTGQTFNTVLSGISNMMFTFAMKNVMPEMIREMAVPKEMHRSWAVANSVTIPCYTLFGFWGMYAFGIFNQNAGFVLNFKHNAWVGTYNVANAFLGYLPLIWGQICVFLKVELALGVLPSDWWTVSNPSSNRVGRLPPVLFRLLFRCSIVGCYAFVAEALIGVGLGFFSSLVGAITCAAFSFYLPWLLYMRFFGQEMSWPRWLVYGAWFAFGVAMSLLGAWTSASLMKDMAVNGLFQETSCSQNAFYVGEFSDGRNDDGDGGFSASQGPGSFYQTLYRAACEDPSSTSQPAINCAQYGTCCAFDADVGHVTCQGSG